MIDMLLMFIVPGMICLAIAVDVVVLFVWMRRWLLTITAMTRCCNVPHLYLKFGTGPT
jgi:hypothetical protein